jgi:hypothetical protein
MLEQSEGDLPKRLRAYIFADKKSQSPESAPSGVRQDMLVTFITCFKYFRGSLYVQLADSSMEEIYPRTKEVS